MFQPSLPPYALASLLVSLAGTAQAAPRVRTEPRSVELTGKAGESPVISLAPGTLTVLILDAPIVRESVQVEGRARFARVDPRDQSITLSPAVPLGPTERLALRFTYREGTPASAVLLLTGQSNEVDAVVNVSRPRQTVEACRVELSVTRERYEAQRQELAELRARPSAVSPAAVALAGLVDDAGVKVANLRQACRTAATGELRPSQCRTLRASKWAVVVLEVRNTGTEPWTLVHVELVPQAGAERRRARAVLPAQLTIPPGGAVSLAVEVEMPVRQAGRWLWELHTLRLCDVTGSRCLSVLQVKL